MSKINRESATARLHITMFGPFRMEIDGEVLKPHRPPNFRMLAYLLLQHDCPVERDEVAICWKKASATEFWLSEARNYLARAVSVLAGTLGCERMRLQKPRPQHLLFETTGADLDLFIWESGIAEGSVTALESIAPLYRKSLLEGWDDPWIQKAREQFREDYLLALLSAARRETAHGRWKVALKAFTLLFEVDPTHEEGLQEHLHLLADRRRIKDMQRLYDAYVRHCETVFDPVDTQITQRYRDLCTRATKREENAESGWLPAPVSRFIPRPTDIGKIYAAVTSERLTTLTGTGGVGKTRLAIAAAEELREEFDDGVWFIDLSELQNALEVPTQILRTFSLSEKSDRTATEEITAFLRTKETLLILDNCEHVLNGSARLAAHILEKCPTVKILATSRESLGITGEAVWQVPGLDFPKPETRFTLETLANFGAVRLLIERVRRSQYPLTIDAKNADAIVQICQYLDGIPLAIELAAVQISRCLYSVQEVADSLSSALAFLKVGSKIAPSRQQTLRAAIEWSYRLLTDAEQRVFERLGVFIGGFTEEAAVYVCGMAPLTTESVGGIVRSLADKSLVEVLFSEQGVRYHLLQTIRQFALELLSSRQDENVFTSEDGSGDESIGIHRRHLFYFSALVEEADRIHPGKEHALWLDRQGREHDNCRSALNWAWQHGENAVGLRLIAHWADYLYTRGYHAEAAEWLAKFLARTMEAPANLRLKATHWAGNIAYAQADYDLACTYFEEGLKFREILGDRLALAIGRASLANAIGAQGRQEEALTLFKENLGVFEEFNDLRNTAHTWNCIGMIADAREDYTYTLECRTRSLQLFREAEDPTNVVLAAGNLAGLYVQLKQYDAARPLLAECLALYRTLHTRHRLLYTLLHYLCVAAGEQEFDRAALILGFAEAFRKRIGYALPPQIGERYQIEKEAVRHHLGLPHYDAQTALGGQMSEEEMIASLLQA